MTMTLTTDQRMRPMMPDDAFADWFVDDFMADELSDYVEDLGRDACRRMTISGRRYAVHFGIARTDLQAQFLYLMWTVGPNFWQFGGFGRVLSARWPDQADKVDALFNVAPEDAEAAIQSCNMDYWYPELFRDNILGVAWLGDDSDG